MDLENELAQRIINLRESKNLTQVELAKRMNLDRTKLNKIEKGTRKVSTEELSQLATILDTTTDYLLGRKSKSSSHKVDIKDLEDKNIAMSYGGKDLTKDDLKIIEAVLKRNELLKDE